MPPIDHQPVPYRSPLRPMVSDYAYGFIVQQAIRHGWTHRDARQRNLGAFIQAIVNHPLQQWGDTRPEWMSSLDHERLNRGQLPMWWDSDRAMDKRQRPLAARFIPSSQIRQFVFSKGMMPNKGASESESGILAYFMEAWGQQCITPLYYPDNTHRVELRVRRDRDASMVIW